MKCFSLFGVIYLIILSGCLNESTEPSQRFANALIETEFLYAETGDPIANEPFFVQVQQQGVQQWIDIDEYTTDDDGMFDIELSSTIETKVTGIRIQYQVDDGIEEVVRGLDLELRYEEPFDEVSLLFELEGMLSESEDGDEDEDENEDNG